MVYMSVVSQSDKILHLSRVPGFRAWSTFMGILSIGIGMVIFSSDGWMWKLFCLFCCVFVAICSLDDWEECIIDKDGEILLKRFSLAEKVLRPQESQRQVVAAASTITKVDVAAEDIRFFGRGHVVMLHFSAGYSMPLTEKCTLGDGKDHQQIAKLISNFLDLDEKLQTERAMGSGVPDLPPPPPSSSSSSGSEEEEEEGKDDHKKTR